MRIRAIIIVPSQGHSVTSFQAAAKVLISKVYFNRAAIVTASTSPIYDFVEIPMVELRSSDGKLFSWDLVQGLASVITISHSGSEDGPNLDYGDGLEPSVTQPWGTIHTEETPKKGNEGKELSPYANRFWTRVGGSLASNGKVILLGCRQGAGLYAKAVANAARRTTFASTDFFAAGKVEAVLAHVRAIEHGITIRPMKSFVPVG